MKANRQRLKAGWIVSLACAGLAWVSCRTTPTNRVDVEQLAQDYRTLTPSTAVGSGIGMAQARQAQKAFVTRIARPGDKPVGYKVGLVTQEAQKRFGASAPVHGVLLSSMMLSNYARLPANFGTQPICEADLLVVIKDKKINEAQSIFEAIQYVSEIVAFIELPDSVLATNRPPNAAMLTAANVGARLGVIGQRVTVQPTESFVQALADLEITLTDQTGATLGQARGKQILDHPLHALLWLCEDLKREGQSLKPGDLISLGGLIIVPPKAGQTLIATYRGLPGPPIQATVLFQ